MFFKVDARMKAPGLTGGVMRLLTGAMIFYCAGTWAAPAGNVSLIEGQAPGVPFTIGIHQFLWTMDKNQNQIMDPDEVMVKVGGKGNWVPIAKAGPNLDLYADCIAWERAARHETSPCYIYKEVPGRSLKLYVDNPPHWKASDRRPAIVWFFGGSWVVGDTITFKPQALYFAQRGAVSIRVDYRVSSRDGCQDLGRTSLMDARSAMRWVAKNAGLLGIDPAKIVAGGDSAGGHLALGTCLMEHINDPKDDRSIEVKPVALLLSNPWLPNSDPQVQVMNYLRAPLPPMFVTFGGEKDPAYEPGKPFLARVRQLGGKLDTLIANEGHGFACGPKYLPITTQRMDELLQKAGLLSHEPVVALPTKTFSELLNEVNNQVAAGKAKVRRCQRGASIQLNQGATTKLKRG